jgi:predicted AAA+ superfamily ATPase
MFTRKLVMELPKKQSAFLWGARQTGKSSFLRAHFPQAIYYDLLDTREVMRFSKAPYLLREEILALSPEQLVAPVIIDEVQKVPELLNEVHYLIEHAKVQFILCGSSARKLKTNLTNLLGGRAWQYHFFPLVSPEIPHFDLLKALSQGLIPNHYLAEPQYIAEHFRAYVDIYLTDEIRNEGLVRNLPAFARFLDIVGISNAEMINMTNVARDCGVSRITVQGYYQILVDTLLGYFIYPYKKKIKRDLISAAPKFYLFDVGIANYLAQQSLSGLKGSVAGKSFEHFILMELIAFREFSRKHFAITYWRTKTGLEVDFILGDATVAIEVKIDEQVHKEDLKGLIAFCGEHPKVQGIVVSQDLKQRKMEITEQQSLTIMPWQLFLTKLWNNKIL